jgi:anaerobic selenocysteine-containing dehydrogenase
LRKREPDPVVVIHPQTAEEHDIAEGEWVVIETRRGRIEQKAKIRDRILPGVVHAAYGWWFPEAGDERLHNWNGSNYNVLTSGDRRGREFGTPDLKGLACRIERKSLHSGQGVKG